MTPHSGNDIIKAIGNAGFSSWHGHGSPATIGCCNWHSYIMSNSRYSLDMILKSHRYHNRNGIDLMNNINNPQIAYSISCDISPFDIYVADTIVDPAKGRYVFDIPYNFGSAFTVAGNYGGPAILCNTREGYVGTSAEMEKEFGEYILKQPKIGIAEALSKSTFPQPHLKTTHHLIGEPEFEMWLDLPKRFENLAVKWQNGNLTVSDTELIGAKIAVFRGNSMPYSTTCSSNIRKLAFSNSVNDFALSIWKTGCLPIIRLYSFQGVVSNQTKYYLVQDAFLGNPLCEDPTNLSQTSQIGKGTKYVVNAINSITAYTGFVIENGAEVTLECDKTITLSCTVKAGGKLTVKAKDVKMTSNFTVEKGGVIEINKK